MELLVRIIYLIFRVYHGFTVFDSRFVEMCKNKNENESGICSRVKTDCTVGAVPGQPGAAQRVAIIIDGFDSRS